ncbi:hypothetical protein ACFXGT_37485 [Streptomyces sp. NPDC059352]|uniref:hypothetical protein n=1 Tax=Streptomyces sp. NPDC059352 TaxID=3346810 RepID=UPI00369A9DDF
MGETSACDRLTAELKTLRDASELTYSAITAQAEKQMPPVKLGKSKLSAWFSGTNVPKKDDDAAFSYLVALLEARAKKHGVPSKGIEWWRARRDEAAAERNPSAAPTKPSPRPIPPATTLPPAEPHPGDVAKAAQLLRLLPFDGSWRRWLENAPAMFKVPLTVSDPVRDAHRRLEKDLPDYVDPELHDAHRDLLTALADLCWELNGMNDISDEGQPVLEVSYPGTSAERNELNRQACQTRDAFIPAYCTMINLLNRKNLLPPAALRPDAAHHPAGPARAPDNTHAHGDTARLREAAAEPRALRVGQGLPERARELRQARQDLADQGLGEPADEAWEHGTTALQDFHHTDPAEPDWVLCLVADRPPVAVAAPVWQEITDAGRADVGQDAFAAIGFPVPPANGAAPWLIQADAQTLDLDGGHWGPGRLERHQNGVWRWHPRPSLGLQEGRSARNWTSSQTPSLRLRVLLTLPWTGTGALEITKPRRQDLEQQLPHSQLAGAMTLLSARRATNLPAARWPRTPHGNNTSRSLSYTCTLSTPDGAPALQANTMLSLPTTTESSVIVCAEVLIDDTDAWAALLQPGQNTRLTLQEAQAVLLGAWETAADLLPKTIGAPDLRWSAPPTIELRLSSERPAPNGVLPPLAQVLDLTSFGDGEDHRPGMAVMITATPRLDDEERRDLLRQALVHMARAFGYIDADLEALH